MWKFLTVLLVWVLVFSAFGAPPKKSAGKKTTSRTAVRKNPAAKKTASKTTKKAASKTRKKSSRKAPRKRASWRSGQMQPTPERYAEIQQALIAKGYLSSPATGVWGPESVDALKRFQHDQNLEPSGKLTSLSLMALGLGPKRDTAGAAPKPGAVPEPQRPPQ